MSGTPSDSTLPYEISDRVARQARTAPSGHVSGGPSVRPLRIYSLDPSVSYRLGGVATVAVPYEPLTPGPVGRLFEVVSGRAPRPLRAAPLDLDQPALLLSSGLEPSPANGQFHLQMV